MKTYRANHSKWRTVVLVEDSLNPGAAYQLDPKPSQALWNHSPTGFEWGYSGSGPAQLALAILLDYTGDAEFSLRQYQDFKWQVVARLPREGFVLTGAEIDVVIRMINEEWEKNGVLLQPGPRPGMMKKS